MTVDTVVLKKDDMNDDIHGDILKQDEDDVSDKNFRLKGINNLSRQYSSLALLICRITELT